MTDRDRAVTARPSVAGGRPALLAGGDVLAVTGVVVAGSVRHGADPLARPLATLEALVPFLVGWGLLAALLGLYGRGPVARGGDGRTPDPDGPAARDDEGPSADAGSDATDPRAGDAGRDDGAGGDYRRVTAAWLGAANVGLVLRGSPPFDGSTTWPFPLVITATVLVAVLAWRAVAARLT